MSDYPSEWRECLLSEVVEKITSGGTPKADNPDLYGGGIPFLKIDDITSSSKYLRSHKVTINERGLSESSAKIIPTGTLLLTMYGTIGRCCITTYPVATNQAIASFLGHPEVELEYLYYALEGKANEFATASSQTTQANISAGILKQTPIAIPPLPEQKKIAEILSGIDHTINKLQDQITKETTLANAVSGDLISGRISHCGHKMSDFGPIPANWEIKKLDECLDLYNHQSKTDGEHEVLTSASKGLMRQSEYYGANRITRRDSTGFNIIPNGYLTYRSRSDSNSFYFNRNDLGITGLVSKYYPVFCPKEGTQGGNFFSLLLNHYAPLLSRESVGTSQVVLSFNALKRVALPIPPPSEQLWISRAIASLKDAIKKEDMKIMSLIELKSSLSSDLLSGRKRVSV
jgi:type I restriction enzyme, S subunit